MFCLASFFLVHTQISKPRFVRGTTAFRSNPPSTQKRFSGYPRLPGPATVAAHGSLHSSVRQVSREQNAALEVTESRAESLNTRAGKHIFRSSSFHAKRTPKFEINLIRFR